MINHIRKINKAIAIFLFILTLSAFIGAIKAKFDVYSLFSLVSIFLVFILLSVCIYYKKFENFINYPTCLLLVIILCTQVHDALGIVTVLIPVCISTLYINKKLLLITSVFFNLSIINLLYLHHISGVSSSISMLLTIDIIICILFLVSKFGKDLLEQASEKGIKATQLLGELEKTMKLIGVNTSALNNDIAYCSKNLESVQEASEGITEIAEQTSNTVKQIDQVMTKIKVKTQKVVDKVKDGNVATNEGAILITDVTEGFKKIQSSFKDIDINIADELKMIENTSSIFSKIHVETESIASISEEQSAATEEMLATMEEQSASINLIYSSMQEIKKASENLQAIV